ncbi:MAG: PAC2 family protein [Actinomycetota bacterium]|nr:PAC2 family protein [Actinomycetota bacterium]
MDDIRPGGHVRWSDRPTLRSPVLVAAFEGWNDAADAASTAARYLRTRWDARPFAAIDPEIFYDFSSTRPQVKITDGQTREILWPTNELSAAVLPDSANDVVILLGTEPQLRWRTFCDQIMYVAEQLNAQMLLTLGALLADVAHTRPVRVSGAAADPDLVQRLGLERSTYEGPTGIVGVLHEAAERRSLPSASLWAAVPHYVAATPSPKATLALVNRATSILASPIVTTDLELKASDYERQVTEVVASDEDVAAYVQRLEDTADHESAQPLEAQSGDALAAELERFLREQHDD